LLAQTDIDRLAGLPGVAEVQGRLWGYYYDSVVKANYTLMARPDAEVAEGTLSIGNAVARERGLVPGNTISFRSYSGKLFSFKVATLLPEDSELLSGDLVLLAAGDFRRFFEYPAGQYTDAVLRSTGAQSGDALAAAIRAAQPELRPIPRAEILAIYAQLFGWRDGIGLAVLAGVILAFVILAWEKAAGLPAEERREIGILKAIGWEGSDVIRMKLWEGLLIALAAFLIGFVAAWLHVFRYDAALFAPALRGWSVLYPSFRLSPVVDLRQLATLFLFTVLPYALTVLLPVWRAARAEPDAVMRA
ncbi:MAG TPA: FtsX-like permease family protein, partial [Azonexus sp.]|nr:FtsX-like permease family protein [Azonexus sp.]